MDKLIDLSLKIIQYHSSPSTEVKCHSELGFKKGFLHDNAQLVFTDERVKMKQNNFVTQGKYNIMLSIRKR